MPACPKSCKEAVSTGAWSESQRRGTDPTWSPGTWREATAWSPTMPATEGLTSWSVLEGSLSMRGDETSQKARLSRHGRAAASDASVEQGGPGDPCDEGGEGRAGLTRTAWLRP